MAPSYDSIASFRYPGARSMFIYVKNAHLNAIPGIRAYAAEFVREGTFGTNGYLRQLGFIALGDAQRRRSAAFATSMTPTGTASTGSVFSFLGIDPLSNLDPAVRELAQTRQLAERAVYYGQRTPKLLGMEVQRLVFELAVMPESVGLLESIGGLSSAAQQTSALAADLPDLLAKERAATIEQLTGILDSRQGQLQSLIVELRSTLEAGTTTSDSVNSTIASLDALIARFDRPASSAGTG